MKLWQQGQVPGLHSQRGILRVYVVLSDVKRRDLFLGRMRGCVQECTCAGCAAA